MLSGNISGLSQKTFKGYVTEVKRDDKFHILLNNAFEETFTNGVFESKRRSHTVVYRCNAGNWLNLYSVLIYRHVLSVAYFLDHNIGRKGTVTVFPKLVSTTIRI